MPGKSGVQSLSLNCGQRKLERSGDPTARRRASLVLISAACSVGLLAPGAAFAAKRPKLTDTPPYEAAGQLAECFPAGWVSGTSTCSSDASAVAGTGAIKTDQSIQPIPPSTKSGWSACGLAHVTPFKFTPKKSGNVAITAVYHINKARAVWTVTTDDPAIGDSQGPTKSVLFLAKTSAVPTDTCSTAPQFFSFKQHELLSVTEKNAPQEAAGDVTVTGTYPDAVAGQPVTVSVGVWSNSYLAGDGGISHSVDAEVKSVSFG